MKYIIINDCLGCPYLTIADDLDKFYCYKVKKIIGDTADYIPDWCLLPDLKEGE